MRIVHDLFKAYFREHLTGLLNQFFASRDPWFEKCGYSLKWFKSSLPKLLLREGRAGLDAGQRISSELAAIPTSELRIYSDWYRARPEGTVSDVAKPHR
jgi:hypothetical protein